MSDPVRFDGWRKSTYSTGGGCVEVGAAAGVFGVRDTKDRAGGTLAFDTAAWANFVAEVKTGRFDR